MSEPAGTWHYGLVARWWAEFNQAEPQELDFYRAAIRKYGEPVLDLGCGSGRLLIPLVAEGFDVDGVDVSADMIAAAQAGLAAARADARLHVQALHELRLERTYRTAYMCGVLGIGGRRDRDREGLRRVHELLEPGGVLLVTHWLPYADGDEEEWLEWLPGRRAASPPPWPESGNRRRTAGGDEIELVTRTAAFDALAQEVVLGMRARLWRDGELTREEEYELRSCVYFAQEILLMLLDAGFRDVSLQGGYTGEPATAADGVITFAALR